MKKILISLVTLVLVFTGAEMLYAAGDLLVTGNLGVGTLTPDNKIVVNSGKIKTIGTYQNQGFIADYVAPGDDPTATALTSGLERSAFLFSKCEGCSNGFHSFAIQARSRANVLLGSPARTDTVFEITEYGMTSIGKYEPAAWLDVSASGYNNIDLFRLSSTDATNGDMFIVKNTGNVGIGTIAPTEKLYVTGNIYATG
ncbi:MAG: hypothetical protein Q7U10_12235, partial [Thermodesulfovibrionia bacterium]|nr:hypothetical protein [Thermodesulfovibrionia bacterium]